MDKKQLFFFSLLLALSFGTVALWNRFFSNQPPYLTVVGGVDMADGLGRQSVELVEALKDVVSVDLKTTYVKWSKDISESLIPFLRNPKSKWGQVVFCQEPIQGSAKKLSKRHPFRQIRIAYSMIESTKIPRKWVEKLNRQFDLVAVPDPFLVDVYQNSGVHIPIFVLPVGRNLDPFLKAPLKKERNSHFVFGCFGAGIGRKNQVGLIRAFAKAFHGRQDVSLLIHCRTCEPTVRQEIENEIKNRDGVLIEFTEGRIDQDQYLDLLRRVDCYVSPSKGEGYSVQPREAMALGIPTIVTDNTAQHTICQSNLVTVVPSPIEEAACYEWHKEPLGSFFSCSDEALAEALIEMEKNYSNYLKKSAAARVWAAQTAYDQLFSSYVNLINPQKVFLGNENRITSEGIVTSSKKLYQKYQTIHRSKRVKGWKTRLSQKIARNAIPDWMRSQIKEDLAFFNQADISDERLTELIENEKKGDFPDLLARYRIHNNRLHADYSAHSTKPIRGQLLEAALNRLLKIAKLPNVDFIVDLEDFLNKRMGVAPVFAFAKNLSLDEKAILVPDFETLNMDPMGGVEKEKHPWNERASKAIWRGAMTGQTFTAANFLNAPRSRLIAEALANPESIDAGFVGICQCEEPEAVKRKFSRFFTDSLKIDEHLKYKYQILVDGNSCAYSRAIWQLFSGSAIFKQNSSNIQWYYRCLIPYVHYIPVATDFSDLKEKIEWAEGHDQEARRIGEMGYSFALRNLNKEDIYLYLYFLLCEYAKKQHPSI